MRYQLLLNNTNLELDESAEVSQLSVLLNKKWENLTNPSTLYSDWSKTINISFSAKNNTFFKNIFRCDNIVTNETIDPRKKIPFILMFENEVIMRGYAKVVNILNDVKNKYYQVALYSTLGYILNELKELTFSTSSDVDSRYIIPNPLPENLTINKNIVKESFEREEHNLELKQKTPLDIIGFYPMYQGCYEGFDSNKIETGGSIYEIGDEYDEHAMRQHRSYYQGIYMYINALIQILKEKIESITDYKIHLDKMFFNDSNPYWKDLVYTLQTPYRQDVDNNENIKNEKYKINPNQYVYNILNMSDLSNSHKKILPFVRSSGDYLYNTETKQFTVNNGESCHFHEQLTYTLFAASIYRGGFGGYCRIRDDNAIYLKIKAIDAFTGKDILGASTTYMFYSNENDRVNQKEKYDYCIDIGITARNYPNAVTNAGTGYEKDKGYYWQGDIVADFDIRTNTPFYIVADLYCANNSKPFETVSISDSVPRWDWLWTDLWQNSNEMGYTNGLTFFLNCVNAEVEQVTNTRSNSSLTMEKIWNTDVKPYDVFINYLKIFRLLMTVDEENKTINIMSKKRFFNDYTIEDWSYKLDRSKEFKIEPIFWDTRYLLFGYNDGSGQRYEYYQNRYKTSYGRYRVDTGYDFNNNEKLLIENISPSMISTKKQSSININTKNPDGADFKGYAWKHYPLEAFVENDAEGSNANNYNGWYFRNKSYDVDSTLSLKDSTGKAYITITDDTEVEIKQNSYCWNTSNKVNCYKYPLLSTYDESGKYSIQFAEPKELYFNPKIVPYNAPKYLYELFHKKYMNELYNVQNKVITAYFYLTPQDFKNFRFNTLIYIDGILYRCNQITDYDISSTTSTKCELIQIYNIDSYTTDNFNLPYLFTEKQVINLNDTTGNVIEEVFSSSDWVIKNKSNWLNVNILDDKHIKIYNSFILRNRLGSILLENSEGLQYIIYIVQEATEHYLHVNKNAIVFERNGGYSRISIESKPDIVTIESKPTWVEAEINDNYFGKTLIINTVPNNTVFGRSGEIVLTNGIDRTSIRVAQQGSFIITAVDDNTGDIITNKPIVISNNGDGSTITATLNKPINKNTYVVSLDKKPLKPSIKIGDVKLKVNPITENESDGGRLKIYSLDGKPLVIDFNTGKVDKRFTVYIEEHSTVNGEDYYNYYESVLDGTVLNIFCIVPEGYEFIGWSDGITENNRTITVHEDIHIFPLLKEISGEEEDTDCYYLYDNGIELLYDNSEIVIIDNCSEEEEDTDCYYLYDNGDIILYDNDLGVLIDNCTEEENIFLYDNSMKVLFDNKKTIIIENL